MLLAFGAQAIGPHPIFPATFLPLMPQHPITASWVLCFPLPVSDVFPESYAALILVTDTFGHFRIAFFQRPPPRWVCRFL